MTSEACDNCDGEGYVEIESPEGWDEGDIESCDWCRGKGGHMVCFGGYNFVTKEKHESLRSLDAVDPHVTKTGTPPTRD